MSDKQDRWDSATIWKLVDVRCRQISDVVAAARIPFFLSLTWALLWAWSLFTYEFGYLRVLEERYAKWEAEIPKKTTAMVKVCNVLYRFEPANDEQWKNCLDKIAANRAALRATLRENNMVTFPGGFGKAHISDLGVLGNMALVLLLAWSFYAVRRENHSLGTFLLVQPQSDPGALAPAKKFLLVPSEIFLSSEHFVYAYHSISQRFLFLFSSKSRPLAVATIALIAFPGVVSACHFLTDARDYLSYLEFMEGGIFVRILVEFALLVAVLSLTLAIVWYDLRTSALLNGWALAVSKVWTAQWDETTQDAAPAVLIDLQEQSATLPSPS